MSELSCFLHWKSCSIFDYFQGNTPLFFIKLNDIINSFTFDNNSFTNFNIDSSFDGIGFDLSHESDKVLLTLILKDCVFINNINTQFGGTLIFDTNRKSNYIILSL